MNIVKKKDKNNLLLRGGGGGGGVGGGGWQNHQKTETEPEEEEEKETKFVFNVILPHLQWLSKNQTCLLKDASDNRNIRTEGWMHNIEKWDAAQNLKVLSPCFLEYFVRPQNLGHDDITPAPIILMKGSGCDTQSCHYGRVWLLTLWPVRGIETDVWANKSLDSPGTFGPAPPWITGYMFFFCWYTCSTTYVTTKAILVVYLFVPHEIKHSP